MSTQKIKRVSGYSELKSKPLNRVSLDKQNAANDNSRCFFSWKTFTNNKFQISIDVYNNNNNNGTLITTMMVELKNKTVIHCKIFIFLTIENSLSIFPV